MLTAGLTEFPGPLLNPADLVTGSDGNFWVLGTGDSGNSTLTVVAPDGTIKASYSIPTADAGATALTLGPDNNVWFVEQFSDKIGVITPAGKITEYAIPNATGGNAPVDMNAPSGPVGVQAAPTSIVTGPDGALWFTESSADAIGRITTAGVISQFPTSGLQPESITLGPDHAIWFTDTSNENTIDRLDANGLVTTKIKLPENFAWPTGLTTGPDGALWFAESGNNAIGRIANDGTVTEIPIRGNFSSPQRLTFDAAGNIWVTGYGGGLARVTQQGLTTIVGLQTPSGFSTSGITTGTDGAIWFTDTTSNQIGRVDPGTVTTLGTDHPIGTDPGQNPGSLYENTLTFTDSVATFFDGNPSGTAADFTARINWGDGSTSDGTVAATGPGQFTVSGTHTYAQFATYSASVTITDVNPSHTPQPNTATVTTSIDVSDTPNPVPLPIFGGGVPIAFAGGASNGGVGSFKPTGSHIGGVPGAKTTSGKPTPVVIKKGTGKPVDNGPSAVTLLRAGYIKTWFMASHYHTPKVQTTTPPKVHHVVVPAPKPVKHVKTATKKVQKPA